MAESKSRIRVRVAKCKYEDPRDQNHTPRIYVKILAIAPSSRGCSSNVHCLPVDPTCKLNLHMSFDVETAMSNARG